MRTLSQAQKRIQYDERLLTSSAIHRHGGALKGITSRPEAMAIAGVNDELRRTRAGLRELGSVCALVDRANGR